MRRWRVVIKEIYITPLEEMFDPFIQFTLGGDFGVILEIKNRSKFSSTLKRIRR